MDDDVVTVAYPKSGTHWMLEILGLIRHNGDPAWVRSLSVWQRSPWIETSIGIENSLSYPPPRMLTTHVPFQFFPKSFLHSNAKVIYVLRNPKDVLVSFYHFCKIFKLWENSETFEEFLEGFLEGKVLYGSWFNHVKDWMQLKDKPNFFSIAYEELQQDLRDGVERICHFLGKELSRQQIDSVVENASFQKMKDNTMTNFTDLPLIDHEKGKFMRKGIVGDWKNHLTVEQSHYFDRVYQETMQGVNIAFPWD